MNNHYITVVFEHGTPMYTRCLSAREASKLFDTFAKMESVTFCQHGHGDGIANTYCKGATF